MNKLYRHVLAAATLILGAILISFSGRGITGAVIGIREIPSTIISALGMVLVFISFMMLLAVNIHTQENKDHASQRMEERKLMPMVINDVLKNGEHYKLKDVKWPDRTSGPTDVYIMRNAADVAPGGEIGQRIITAGRDPNRKFRNIVVLTDENKNVKTTYVRNDTRLENWMKKHVYEK